MITLVKILLFLSIASNVTASIIYIVSIFRNKIKPHAFTFLIWSIILGINFAAQISGGVGLASLLIGSNLLACVVIFFSCIKRGNVLYDKIDVISLSLGILAIVLWLITKTALYSVILSCLIDVFAFIPSFKKSYFKPREDSWLTYVVSGFEYIFSFPSYNIFSFVTLLYPICIITLDFSYAILILIRKRQLQIK